MRHVLACPAANLHPAAKNIRFGPPIDPEVPELQDREPQYISINLALAALHGRSVQDHIDPLGGVQVIAQDVTPFAPALADVPRPVQLAINCINERYANPKLSLAIVSGLAHVSERHLSRLFKSSLGKTFHRQLHDVRMTKAGELLISSGCDIKNITGMVGYNDSSHFCEDFRHFMGCTPLQFRNRLAAQRR